jgi:YegS/Rv2252/BmrU family lipid kinase
MEIYRTRKRNLHAKLIFNPNAGAADEANRKLMEVTEELQATDIKTEPYIIEPNCDLPKVIQEAIGQGIRLFIACGGDGTVSSVAKELIGTNAILGIIPTGTQNNIAYSLGISTDIASSVATLSTGRHIKIDIGKCTCNNHSTPCIEVCSVGLFSSLFPSADDILHGDLTRIGDFIATITTTPPSEILILLDNEIEFNITGHVVLISNMPYIFRHFQVGSKDSFEDGLIDVLFFADQSKLDLIRHAIKSPGTDFEQDPRIQHYRARSIIIDTVPAMPIMADGVKIGEGSVKIDIQKRALSVLVPTGETKDITKSGDSFEK